MDALGPSRTLLKPSDANGPYLFNESVDQDRRIIFVAIPKTGTNSIRHQIVRKDAAYMIDMPHLNIRQIRSGLVMYFWLTAMGCNESYPSDPERVREHGEAVEEGERFYESCFKFSSVRNPWARVASLYSRREGLQLSDELDFDGFCKGLRYASDTCIFPTRHACQIDWLLGEDGEIAVDHVMRLEELSEGIARVKELSGGRAAFHPLHLNDNPASPARSYRDFYGPEARDHVAKVFRRDIEAFGYSF